MLNLKTEVSCLCRVRLADEGAPGYDADGFLLPGSILCYLVSLETVVCLRVNTRAFGKLAAYVPTIDGFQAARR
jgi:hypothetical protein